MATDTETRARDRAADAGRRPYRFSVGQFWRLLDSGIIPESHVELVRGRIYRMTRHEPHNFSTRRAARLLEALLPQGLYVRKEESMRHEDSSVLEPDVAVVPGSADAFQADLPKTSEAALIVEVCASTRTSDYRLKTRLYASAGVPVYWVVDVDGRKIDVFSEPTGAGREASYSRHAAFAEGEPAPVVVDGVEVGRIDAKELLPPLENPKKPTTNPPA